MERTDRGPDVFISYSHEDRHIVERLVHVLESRGIAVWYDSRDIPLGGDVESEIEGAVKRSKAVISVVTPASLKSRWVNQELRAALERDPAATRKRIIAVVEEGSELPEDLAGLQHFKFRDSRDLEEVADSVRDALLQSGDGPELGAILDVPEFATMMQEEFGEGRVSTSEGSQARSGPCEILDSGTVFTFRGHPIELEVPGSTLRIVFEFTNSEDDPTTPKMKGKTPTKGVLWLELTNFNNPIGSGTVEPIGFGHLGGRNAYLHFRVSSVAGGREKVVHYTIFLESESEVER